MKTIDTPSATGSRPLKLGIVIGAILLLGLVAVAKLTAIPGDRLGMIVVLLLYLAVAAAIPRGKERRSTCG